MPISDKFSEYTSGLSSPICGGFDIAPEDATNLASVTRAIIRFKMTDQLTSLMLDGPKLLE